MKFVIGQERITSTYDAKTEIANYNITLKNISHTTAKIPDNIKSYIENNKYSDYAWEYGEEKT